MAAMHSTSSTTTATFKSLSCIFFVNVPIPRAVGLAHPKHTVYRLSAEGMRIALSLRRERRAITGSERLCVSGPIGSICTGVPLAGAERGLFEALASLSAVIWQRQGSRSSLGLLVWWELFPQFSFLLLRLRRCGGGRGCKRSGSRGRRWPRRCKCGERGRHLGIAWIRLSVNALHKDAEHRNLRNCHTTAPQRWCVPDAYDCAVRACRTCSLRFRSLHRAPTPPHAPLRRRTCACRPRGRSSSRRAYGPSSR